MKAVDPWRAAEAFFHERIPLTRTMGLRVVQDNGGAFTVEAPVALNFNHLQTAFGGSINAVATLAGYGFLWLELRDRPAHIVIGESTIRFLRPIREVIRAVCERVPAQELAAFNAQLREKGKARMTLRVHVEEHGVVAAEFEGLFVAVSDTAAAN